MQFYNSIAKLRKIDNKINLKLYLIKNNLDISLIIKVLILLNYN